MIGRFAGDPLRCLGTDTGEIEATAKALAENPEQIIIDWYPKARRTTVPVKTVPLKGKAQETGNE